MTGNGHLLHAVSHRHNPTEVLPTQADFTRYHLRVAFAVADLRVVEDVLHAVSDLGDYVRGAGHLRMSNGL